MIKSIRLTNYRNISRVDTELTEGINMLIAPNGSGKSNFIESIHYTFTGNLFRQIEDRNQLIKENESQSSILIDTEFANLLISLEKNILGGVDKKILVNDKKSNQRGILNKHAAILFAPTSVDLVAGEPSVRRRDLDEFIIFLNPQYKSTLESYDRVLKNRNALLKEIKLGRAAISEIDFWTKKLCEMGNEIWEMRNFQVDELNSRYLDLIDHVKNDLDISTFNSIKINYLSNIIPEDNYFDSIHRKFEENKDKEIIVGKTLYGVHKDDFNVEINNKNMRFLGSRGQQRIGVLLYKLGLFNRIREEKEINPVLLLDDIMSELDVENRKTVGKLILDVKTQVILTSADRHEIPSQISEIAKIIDL